MALSRPSPRMASGTGGSAAPSMAAPHVAGICALIQEKYKQEHSEAYCPSELVKALLINHNIPIKDNSSDALAGYASTAAGYGLANAYSVTDSLPNESQQLLAEWSRDCGR